MFGIGAPELLLILVIALVVIGPEKLPDLARAIGKGVGEFRKATDELKASFQGEEEFKDLKKSLSEAKQGMSDIVRQSTEGLGVDKVAEALADGKFFDQTTAKPSVADESVVASGTPETSPATGAEDSRTEESAEPAKPADNPSNQSGQTSN